MVSLILRNLIELRYALIWLSLGCVLIGFTLMPKVWTWFANLLGIIEPVNMLFLFSNLALLVLVLNLLVDSSKQCKRIQLVAQEIAIIKNSVEHSNQ